MISIFNSTSMASISSISGTIIHLIYTIICKLLKYAFIWLLVSVVIVVLLTIFGPDYPFADWYTRKDLGDNYYVDIDNNLLYRQSPVSSEIIIPFKLISANADERWLIATTEGLNAVYRNDSSATPEGKQYWILDKTAPRIDPPDLIDESGMLKSIHGYSVIGTSGLTGPFDSLEFRKELNRLDIDLRLRPLPNW